MQITTIITAFGLVAAAIAAPAAESSPKEGLKEKAKTSWGYCCVKTAYPAYHPGGGKDMSKYPEGCKYQQKEKPSCKDDFPIPWTCTYKEDDYDHEKEMKGDNYDYNKGKKGDNYDYNKGKKGDNYDYNKGKKDDNYDYNKGKKGYVTCHH